MWESISRLQVVCDGTETAEGRPPGTGLESISPAPGGGGPSSSDPEGPGLRVFISSHWETEETVVPSLVWGQGTRDRCPLSLPPPAGHLTSDG